MTQKKAILFYFNSLQPAGGIERVICTLANKLSNQYSIEIIVKDRTTSFYPLNSDVSLKSINNELILNMNNKISRVFSQLSSFIHSSLKLRRLVNLNDYHRVYVAHPLNLLELFVAGLNLKSVVVSEHASKEHYNIFYRFIKKCLYKYTAHYVIPTTIDTEKYINEGFPALYIPHFKSDLNYYQVPLLHKKVLNIGRFTPDKQQLDLIDIWHTVCQNKSLIDWELVIVGSGELENRIKEKIKLLNLNSRIKVQKPTNKIENEYHNSSIFVLTSRNEGFGMVLLEATSFGIPCVSYDCLSGPRDIIINNFNGYLTPVNEKYEFAKKLEELMSNRDLLEKLGNNAFEFGKSWDDEKILRQWQKVFN